MGFWRRWVPTSFSRSEQFPRVLAVVCVLLARVSFPCMSPVLPGFEPDLKTKVEYADSLDKDFVFRSYRIISYCTLR